MKLSGPFNYKITFDPQKIKSVLAHNGDSKFSGEASKRVPKIYIISKDKVPLYVGETRQIVRNRLRTGFNAIGEHGYYGYDWRRNIQDADVDVWVQVEGDTETKREIETVEAEVVYLIRQEFGQWPAHQTEIHFHPSNPVHRKEARKIIEHFLTGALSCPTG